MKLFPVLDAPPERPALAFPDGAVTYPELAVRAADLADTWLVRHGRTTWRDEIRLMIGHHHKIRSYRGPSAPLVEATRKADWIDVSFGAQANQANFGLIHTNVQQQIIQLPVGL